MAEKMNKDEFLRLAQKHITYLIDEFCDGSQRVFCEKTGLTKGSVSQYVNGKNVPNNITAKKIADVFGVLPAWVMGLDEYMTEEERFVKETVPIINATMDTKQSFGATMTANEIRIIEAYRKADECIQSVVAKLLDIGYENTMPIAAHDSDTPLGSTDNDREIMGEE